MNRHAPDDLLLSAARIVEMAEKIDQKKRDRLLFRLAREAIRADEVIARMGYQIMMLETHLKSARASAEHWEESSESYRRTANQLAERVALAEGKLDYLRSTRAGEMGEKLYQMEQDYECERSENERLRKALNQIAMSPFSSQAAKGTAAVALNEPKTVTHTSQAASGAPRDGVTGRRDGQSLECNLEDTNFYKRIAAPQGRSAPGPTADRAPLDPAVAAPNAVGVARMHDNDRAILVMLERRPTDDELRVLHDVLAGRHSSPSGDKCD